MNPIVLVAVIALAVAGCAASPPTARVDATMAPSARAPLAPDWRREVTMLLHVVRPGLYTGAQPAARDWPVLARHGIATVIDLRTPGERVDRDEAAEVRAAGLRYEHLPIDGEDGVRIDAARELAARIDAAPGPVLVHCASSDRAGAMVALMASLRGAAPDDALAQGRAAGMRRTEDRVRLALRMPPATSGIAAPR